MICSIHILYDNSQKTSSKTCVCVIMSWLRGGAQVRLWDYGMESARGIVAMILQ